MMRKYTPTVPFAHLKDMILAQMWLARQQSMLRPSLCAGVNSQICISRLFEWTSVNTQLCPPATDRTAQRRTTTLRGVDHD